MKILASSLFTAALLTLAAPDIKAQDRQFVDVNVAGWSASEAFGGEANTGAAVTVNIHTIVVGFEWIDLQYSALGFNWLSDLVISVSGYSVGAGNFDWLEWAPSTIDFPGNYGPSSGSWGGGDGKPGPYTGGAAFVGLGSVYVSVYNAYPQGDALELQSGVLRINLAPVPEPASWGLFAVGMMTITFLRRRSRQGGSMSRWLSLPRSTGQQEYS